MSEFGVTYYTGPFEPEDDEDIFDDDWDFPDDFGDDDFYDEEDDLEYYEDDDD